MSFWRSRKVLVTGGCGFLGSYLVEELLAAGAEVTVVDNLEAGTLENIASVRDHVRFVQADLIDLDACLNVSKGMEAVMNLVGRVYGVGYSSKHHGEMLTHNTVAQLNVLEAARRNEVERFLVVSSSCVYPDDAPVPIPEIPVLTLLPERANEGYGWAKRIAELQARYYSQEYGMKIAISRPSNAYGSRYPWRGDKNSFVMPTLVKKIMDRQNPLVVWGSGQQRRNFLHARDMVKIMMMLTERYACAEAVNIGYENDISIAELVSLICDVTGQHPEVIFDTSQPEGRFRKCMDSTLLRKVTDNYRPEISLKDGIQEMVEWYYHTFKRN
jgi:nucleoside-diphosphate-sugar epimerase